MTETRFDVSCHKCGKLIGWSYKSQAEAEESAFDSQAGVNDSRFGGWLCLSCYEPLFEKMVNPRGDYCQTEDWVYDHSNAPGVTVEIRTARTPKPCHRHRNCEIKPGQVYIRQAIAPWTMVADDVDDEGRTIGSRAGEWSYSSMHRYDDEANEDRKGECKFSDCRALPGQPHKETCPRYIPEPRKEM